MKKSLFLINLIVCALVYSSASYADRDHYGRGGYGRYQGEMHGHGHGHHYAPRPQIIYYPAPQVHYYPAPPVHYYPQPQVNYYPQPQVNYYPRQAQYSGDQRSHQGLAGGVIGSVFGYELGSGDPLVTGLGAAAGSFLGNGMNGSYSGRR